MQRLIVCADGTWNSRDAADPSGKGLTNVAKLERAIAPADAAGVPQRALYHAGVGVGPWWDRMLGGAFGQGLSKNIQECYRWLVEQYQPGDQLFLFGFSRGAYTARSLAGLIRNCGILEREHAGRIGEAYDLYRDRGDDSHPNSAKAQAFRARYAHEAGITCIGVWDTVGSLGVPTRGPIGMLTRHRYGFHDVTLSGRVANAFHALAIDERRKPFAPTLWEVPADAPAAQAVEQVWFAGVHSNVGGGYEDCALSDLALRWMAEKARGCGLALVPGFERSLGGKCEGKLNDSMTTFYRAMGTHTRPIAARHDAGKRPARTFESVHESALQRRATCAAPPLGPYDPPNLKDYVARAGKA
jgi:uncharacterized protein (DUF2235 family)